jgi:5'-methylthioadenosine phosphorylase
MFAVIGRVGFHKDFQKIGAKELSVFKLKTPFGISNPIHLMEKDNISFYVLSRHGEDDYEKSAPFLNPRAYLWALKKKKTRQILSWSAPGAIHKDFKPGDIVIPHDVIDETKTQNFTFFEGKGLGFIRSAPLFCPDLRLCLTQAMKDKGFQLHTKAVYGATSGPRVETKAEIKKLQILGADIVGQSIVPEVFLARELELCYAVACYIVNYAEGIKQLPFIPGILFEGLLPQEETIKVKKIEEKAGTLILETIKYLSKIKPKCHCKDLMLRYKLKGSYPILYEMED